MRRSVPWMGKGVAAWSRSRRW